MAGGTWTNQDKILPGTYVNTVAEENVSASIGSRGVVLIPKALSWGAAGEIMRYTPGEDPRPYIGYELTDGNAIWLREMMKGSDRTNGPTEIMIYRLKGTGGAKASATAGGLTVTALYEGVRGNDIAVTVEADPDSENGFDVATLVSGRTVDSQNVTAISQLTANAWVTFSGDGALEATAGTNLTGGTDPTVAAADYSEFLTAAEPYADEINILAYDGEDQTVGKAVVAFAKRMYANIGNNFQIVACEKAVGKPDSDLVISVANGVVLDDGTEISAREAVWWLAGAQAGASYNESLTYVKYPDAVAPSPRLAQKEAEEAVKGGKICFVVDAKETKLCVDINTKTSYRNKEEEQLTRNRTTRMCMQLRKDEQAYFNKYFVGAVDDGTDGKNLFRAWLIDYMNKAQANNGIKEFDKEDIVVSSGDQVGAIRIQVSFVPAMAVEKIYVDNVVRRSE